MNTISKLFYSPKMAFNELRQDNRFPAMTLTVLLLVYLINMILMIPVMSKMMTITLSAMPFGEEQMEKTLQVMHKMRYLQAFGTMFVAALTLFVYAFLLYIITLIAKPALTFVQSVTIVVYSYFAVVIGGFVNTGVLYLRGLDTITSPYDITATGLNLLTSVEKTGAAAYTALSLVNPFELWFVLLMGIGLSIFMKIKYTKALLLAVIFWMVILLYTVVSVLVSEMTMKSAGITL